MAQAHTATSVDDVLARWDGDGTSGRPDDRDGTDGAVAAFDEGNNRMHLAIPPNATASSPMWRPIKPSVSALNRSSEAALTSRIIPCRSTVMMPSITLSTTVRIRLSLALNSAVRDVTTLRSEWFQISSPINKRPPNY